MRTTLRKTELVATGSKPFEYKPKWAFPNVLDVMQRDLPSLENLPEGTKAVIVRLGNALTDPEVRSLSSLSDKLGIGAVILYNVKEFHKNELNGTNLAQRLFYAERRKEALAQAKAMAARMSSP